MTKLNDKQIKDALKAGIISPDQAVEMHAANKKTTSPQPDQTNSLPSDQSALIGNEDDMRFVRSFSDVFIAIGIGLLSLGVMALCGLMGGGVMYLAGAAFMWVLAEYFGKKKRAHLPTLLIGLAYLLFVQRGADVVLSTMPALITLVAMVVFYWRFKLPFSICLIAISIGLLVYSWIGSYVPIGVFLITMGLAFFAAALAYDTKDTGRLTRFSDNAFWLHFAAAPLILHGIAFQILAVRTTKVANLIPVPDLGRDDAVIMLCIIGFLALVGLAINRRALLVSSLGYAMFSLVMIFKGNGLGIGVVFTSMLLVLGGSIVFLGAGWHRARSWLLKLLPTSGVFGKIFPPVDE